MKLTEKEKLNLAMQFIKSIDDYHICQCDNDCNIDFLKSIKEKAWHVLADLTD